MKRPRRRQQASYPAAPEGLTYAYPSLSEARAQTGEKTCGIQSTVPRRGTVDAIKSIESFAEE